MYNEVDKKELLHNDVRFNVAYVADVFPFRAGRGEETPAQMAMTKVLSSIKGD